MKRLLILLAFLPFTALAQDSTGKFSMGPAFAYDRYLPDKPFNKLQFHEKYDIKGVSLGIAMSYRLRSNIEIEAGLRFRKIVYSYLALRYVQYPYAPPNPNAPLYAKARMHSSNKFLTFPLSLNYTFRSKVPVFIAAGGNLEYLYLSTHSYYHSPTEWKGWGFSTSMACGVILEMEGMRYKPALRAGYMMTDHGEKPGNSECGIILKAPFASLDLSILIGE